MKDRTEQKRAEEALQRERDFANSLVETAQTIVLVLDMDGRIVRFNRFARELTGYTEEEVLGRSWLEMFIPPGEQAHIGKVFGGVASGSEARGVENPILAKDGREILVRWFNSLITDPQHRPANVLSIGHDITEIRQRDEQLRQAAKMEAMGRLVGGIAHDFNNMLAVVQGYSDLLLQSLPPDSPELEDVRQIRNAAARAAELTRQLLAFGRKQIVRPHVLDLNRLVANMTAMLRSSLGERVRVRIVPEEAIWPIKADPAQIEEVVLNLALNAGDAMDGGGELDVETANVRLVGPINHEHGRVPPAEYVVLTVRDSGEGMSPEVRRRLFEPFFTTKAPGKGSGMGLATCYGIVTQSGGHILADSRPGKGSSFRVYLPRTDEPLPPPETSPPEEEAAEELPGGQETIMVVEDMPDVRQIVVRVLRQCGYAVLEAADARQALPLGEHYEGDIDLLLTDVVMPDMGGEDLAERLSGVRPRMKVLFVSGYAGPVSGRKGALRGGENVLAKPFTPAQLASAVRDVLDARPRRTRRTRNK